MTAGASNENMTVTGDGLFEKYGPSSSLIRAKALVAFPGGFGTLDELFETLTLVQTGKVQDVVIVLVGQAFWERLINRQMLIEDGLIGQDDQRLFHYAETAQEAWELIVRYHGVTPS